MVQDLYATLVALASKSSVVPYDRLMAALGINNERQLEDFVIQAIYQDIIQVFYSLKNPKELKIGKI